MAGAVPPSPTSSSSKDAAVIVESKSASSALNPHDVEAGVSGKNLHLVERGTAVIGTAAAGASSSPSGDDGAGIAISGFDAERMAARAALTTAEEKALLRRIDWRLMTLCSVIFLIKNLDAANVANARIMSLGTPRNIMAQLNITPDDYGLLAVLYFIPYIVFEAPSNLLLKYFKPSTWQSRIMISWGIATICHVPVTNRAGIFSVRFLLGMFEAGMFPGVILQMTYWYRPDEMSIRLLIFYVMGNFSGIISGVLAFGFDEISGARGLSGWQWLFLTEGVITIAFGFAIYFLLPDFPDTAKWLTERERAFVQARLPPNAPRAAESAFEWSEIVDSFKDVRLWLFTLIWATFTVGTQGVSFYQPTVINNMGFTTVARAQLLNLPISVLGIATIFGTGLIADRGVVPRPLFPLSIHVVVLVCYAVMVAYPSVGAAYAATLLGGAAAAAFYPLMWPWRVQTTKRATGSAFGIGFVNSYGQIGGAIGPQIFRQQYAPRYRQSFAAAMVCVAACSVTTLSTWWVTRGTEAETRRLKLARRRADEDGKAVLEDVVDRDLRRKPDSESS